MWQASDCRCAIDVVNDSMLLLFLCQEYYIYYLCFLWWLRFTHPAYLELLPQNVGNLQVIKISAGSLEVCFVMRLFAFRRIKGSLALICNTGVRLDWLANIICFSIWRLCSTFMIKCLVLNYEVITHGVMMLLMFELPFMVMSYIYKEVLRFIDSAAKFWSKLNYEN